MKKNMTSFYLYRIFSRLYYHIPMLFVYFYVAGLSILRIELMLAVYGVVLMIVPRFLRGFKNKHKQKTVIMYGEAIKAIGLLCLLLSNNIALLITGQILCGLGYSFTAGTESVLLRKLFGGYEGSDYEYKQVESQSNSYMYISFLVGGISGSIIYQVSHPLIFVLSITSNILALLSAAAISEPNAEPPQNLSGLETSEDTQKQDINARVNAGFWKNYYALSRAAALAVFIGFLPYYFFLVVDVNIYYFSAILSLFNAFGFLSSRVIVVLSRRFEPQNLAVCTSFILIAGFIIFAFSNNLIVSILIISLLGLASGGVRPITLANINQNEMSQEDRTKILSSMEQQYGFWNASLLIAGGIVLTQFGFTICMISLIILYTLLIFINILTFKNKKKEKLA